MKTFFTLLLALCSFSSAYGDDASCRLRATQVYNDCLNGDTGGGDSGDDACRHQTRCEDLCLAGRKVCRVFDCNGQIVSTYQESCLDQVRTYSCSTCYERESSNDPHLYHCNYCYKVFETTNGARNLIDTYCTGMQYCGILISQRCDDERRSDARCGE